MTRMSRFTSEQIACALERSEVGVPISEIHRLYLRPSYLWRLASSVRSRYKLRAQARKGLTLLLRHLQVCRAVGARGPQVPRA